MFAFDSEADAALLDRVRSGDDEAYGLLWDRHRAAAENFARQLSRHDESQDLVAEAFARVLSAIRGGNGPEGAFRPYLLTVIRRVNIDWATRYHNRVVPTADENVLDTGAPQTETPEARFARGDDRDAALAAWAALSSEAQTVLWHVVIEGEKPQQVAPMLGMSANVVSARTMRAKETLRQAYLQQHVVTSSEPACQHAQSNAARFVRDRLGARSRRAIGLHIDNCGRCQSIVREIRDINRTLRAVIAPLLLGFAAAQRYLSSLSDRHPDISTAVTQAASAAEAVSSDGGSPIVARLAGGLVAATVAITSLVAVTGGSHSAAPDDAAGRPPLASSARPDHGPFSARQSVPASGESSRSHVAVPTHRPTTAAPRQADGDPTSRPEGAATGPRPSDALPTPTSPRSAAPKGGEGATGSTPLGQATGGTTAPAASSDGPHSEQTSPTSRIRIREGTQDTTMQSTTSADGTLTTSDRTGSRGQGTIDVALPGGFTLESLTLGSPGQGTCVVTDEGHGSCTVYDPVAAMDYQVALKVSGPADTGVTATVTYTDAVDMKSTDVALQTGGS